jgi:uncharacterized protein (DUF2249 family)
MKISPKTTIAKLIQAHPDALNVIVGISPKFKKLHHPVLRKLMAGRTSIAQAAAVANITVEEFFMALKPLGFVPEYCNYENSWVFKQVPPFLNNIPEEKRIIFDARPYLENNLDPLKEIIPLANKVKEGEALIILNNFEPLPLINLLGKRNLDSFVLKISDNLYETWFFPVSGPVADGREATFVMRQGSDWERLMADFAGNIEVLNVRGLPMPQPMLTILEALENLPKHKALFVHHEKVPVFLLQELADRSYAFRMKEYPGERVELLIFLKHE